MTSYANMKVEIEKNEDEETARIEETLFPTA